MKTAVVSFSVVQKTGSLSAELNIFAEEHKEEINRLKSTYTRQEAIHMAMQLYSIDPNKFDKILLYSEDGLSYRKRSIEFSIRKHPYIYLLALINVSDEVYREIDSELRSLSRTANELNSFRSQLSRSQRKDDTYDK